MALTLCWSPSVSKPVLVKYRAESQVVLNHLHLFALQKAAYLALDRSELLNQVISKDSALPRPDYRRAWEIVGDEKTYGDLIDELRMLR